MSAHPEMVDFDTGEIASDPRTPLQIAKSELAAFKFRLIETVAADPKLRKAPCVNAIVVMIGFVTIDERTLKPTPAYASLITLMARGGMKETAAKEARKLLVEQKYLVPTGSKTKDGCIKYRVENPHAERVATHVAEASEYWKERAAEERRQERIRKQQNTVETDVGAYSDPTEQPRGVAIQPDVGAYSDPNYHGTYLGGSGSEEEATLQLGSTSQTYGQEDDPHLPYPVPETAAELQSMLEELFSGCRLSPTLMAGMRGMLMAGNLTPAMVAKQREFAA